VVEAKLARHEAHKAEGVSAARYVKDFRKDMLELEAESFTANAWRIALSDADLAHTESFLSGEASIVMARAQFLRSQLLDSDDMGLHVDVVMTSDSSNKPGDLTATAADGGEHTASPKACAVTGPAYDSWSGSTVSPSQTCTISA
jgi:hypothetical protein